MGFLATLTNLFKKTESDLLREWVRDAKRCPQAPSLGGLVFRLRFTLPTTLAIQSDEHYVEMPYHQHNRRLILSASGGGPLKKLKRIVLKGGPFPTEEEAAYSGQQAKRAVMLSLARLHIGASFGMDEAKSVLTDHGREYYEQLIGERVFQDVPDVVVFDDRIPTRFLNIGADFVKGSPPERLGRTIRSALLIEPEFTEREALALELFGASFFEQSPRARFLALMIVVEAMLEPKQRSPEAVRIIESVIEQVRSNTNLVERERESLCGTLRGLKRESISQTGQNAADKSLVGKRYSELPSAAFFKLCYQIRSDIVHTGAVRAANIDIGSLVSALENFAADLLCARFEGLEPYP